MGNSWVERVKDRMKNGPWKMTRGALAREVGVSRSTLDRWFEGTREPRLTEAIKLANLFDCSLDELFRPEWWAKNAARRAFRRTLQEGQTEPDGESREETGEQGPTT